LLMLNGLCEVHLPLADPRSRGRRSLAQRSMKVGRWDVTHIPCRADDWIISPRYRLSSIGLRLAMSSRCVVAPGRPTEPLALGIGISSTTASSSREPALSHRLAAITVCVRSSLRSKARASSSASFVISRRASGCITSPVSPKLAVLLPSGSNGTTPSALTSFLAIAASVSSAPNSWLDRSTCAASLGAPEPN
jgi:hypothetical protein